MARIINDDCIAAMKRMDSESIDTVVTDPPYGLAFMGKAWDHAVPGVEYWAECMRVLKPGGHLAAFGGARLFHRLTCAIEDAGFEIRDCLMWVYGTGFPKSHDVSKAIDKAAGAEREVIGRMKGRGSNSGEGRYNWNNPDDKVDRRYYDQTAPATPDAIKWQGWGTALKPAWEPIVLARKPVNGTVAANVVKHGTGALNIDGCRVATDEECRRASRGGDNGLLGSSTFKIRERKVEDKPKKEGRWPANLVHDGSDDVVQHFPQDKARFFYCAKASQSERNTAGKNTHATVKPLALMRWLCRMVTPPNGLVLDPFCGSGSTVVAAMQEGFRAVGIEKEPEYADIARRRCEHEES